jgi:hypothetical protein
MRLYNAAQRRPDAPGGVGPRPSGEPTAAEMSGMCNDCFVIAAMKSRIAAHGAAFRKATRSPFGSDDEIGMLNLIDAAARQAIMDRADPSRVYDLSVDNFVGMPGDRRGRSGGGS